MKHFIKKEEIETKEHTKIYNITSSIKNIIENSKITEGHVLIQPMHTTIGIYLNEGEKLLFEDLIKHLDNQAPQTKEKYKHNNIPERNCSPDEPENAHSHIKAALYSNPLLSLILHQGKLQLGKYQKILLAEFDGPCPRKHKEKRTYTISILGE